MRATRIIMGLACLAGCKASVIGPAIGEGEAAKIASEAEASFTSGDLNAIMSHYAPGAVVFDPGTNAPSQDRAQQTKWTQALVTMQPRRFDPGKRTVQPLGPEVFISSGISSIDVTTGQGIQTVHLRYTDVFQKQADGHWRIVHEHNSALPVPSMAGAAA